ncbi:hypothetical protein D9R17_00045, partial [Corynebacterium diphtheriae]
RPADIAQECCLHTHASVYAWAQRYREEGQWGLRGCGHFLGMFRVAVHACVD